MESLQVGNTIATDTILPVSAKPLVDSTVMGRMGSGAFVSPQLQVRSLVDFGRGAVPLSEDVNVKEYDTTIHVQWTHVDLQ